VTYLLGQPVVGLASRLRVEKEAHAEADDEAELEAGHGSSAVGSSCQVPGDLLAKPVGTLASWPSVTRTPRRSSRSAGSCGAPAATGPTTSPGARPRRPGSPVARSIPTPSVLPSASARCSTRPTATRMRPTPH